jgi:hypothetical protein
MEEYRELEKEINDVSRSKAFKNGLRTSIDKLNDLIASKTLMISVVKKKLIDLAKGKVITRDELLSILPKVGKTLFSMDDVMKEIKGSSKKQMTKTELIKAIPHDTYNEKHVHKIVELIRDGTITDIEQFPKPSKTGKKVSLEFTQKKKQKVEPEPESESDESESDEEAPPPPPVKKGFNPSFTKFGNLDNFSKDMLVKVLERRTKIDPKVRASIRNAIKNNKCKSPEQFDNYKLKEKKAPPPKPPKKVKPTEAYYGLPPVPPKKHQASMLESAKAKKINYWGLKKADPKVIESVNEKPKEKKGEVMVKMAGLKGQLTRLKREYDQAKTGDDKQAKMTEFESKRQELLQLNEKYQKMT